MANEQIQRELDRMLNPQPATAPDTPRQPGPSGLPQAAPAQTPGTPTPPTWQQPAADVGRPPTGKIGTVVQEAKPATPEAPAEPKPTGPVAPEAPPEVQPVQPTEAPQPTAPGEMPAEVAPMQPKVFNYMPSEGELAGIPPDTPIETPDGSIYMDKESGQRRIRLNEQGYKRAKARAVKNFGHNPFSERFPGAPEPSEILKRGIEGKKMFNPFSPDFSWLGKDTPFGKGGR